MLVLITAFSFIACDGDPTPGPDPDPDPDPTPDPVPTDTLPENVSGTLDIYISLNEDEAAAYQMVADEYTYLQKEKGNTVKVNINNNSTADSYQKEVEALISMGVSNATIAKTGVAPSYYGTDSIVDLSSYLSLKNPYADNQVWKDVLEPEAYAPKFARGKSTVPSISYDTNYLVVFYDTRALADLGLQVPTTWDEMIACLEAASKDSDFKNPLGLGVDSGSATRTFLAWVVQMYMDQYFRDFIDVAHSQKGDYSYSSRIDGNYEYDLSDLLLGDSSNYTYNLNRMIDAYFNDTDEWGPLSPRFQDMMANLQELLPYIDTKASYGDLFNRFNETASSYNADGSDNGLYHDRKIFYIQRLDYILTYKTAFETKGTKLSVKDIGDRLGWFAASHDRSRRRRRRCSCGGYGPFAGRRGERTRRYQQRKPGAYRPRCRLPRLFLFAAGYECPAASACFDRNSAGYGAARKRSYHSGKHRSRDKRSEIYRKL